MNKAEYKVIFIYFALALVTLIVFRQVTKCDFADYDDLEIIVKNQHVNAGLTLEGTIWAFTIGKAVNWIPLTWLSHMLDYQLFGDNPLWHHLTNLILHIVNTLLLFAVLKRMTAALWQSAFVAALFALHPLHVESVAWVSERKDVLSALFWILTIAAYLRYVRYTNIKWYLLTLLLFTMGLMAKPMVVTLPFVLLLLDYWPLDRFKVNGTARLIREKIPFLVLSAVSSVITFLVQQSAGAVSKIESIPLLTRLANAFVSYMAYIEKMVWPSRLAVLYPYPVEGLPMQRLVTAVLLLLGISFWVIHIAKNSRYLLVGWLWYLGTLVPVIGLIQVGNQSMADRYTYLPSIGIFIMIAWGISEISVKWRFRKILLCISSVAVLSAFSICTYFQLHYWQNSVTLFEHTIKVTRNNLLAYINLDNAYVELGRYNDAVEACKQAISIKPNYAKAHYNLSVAYIQLGRWQDAIEACEQAISIKPNYAKAYYSLGVAYGRLGRQQDKIEACKRAIKIEPDYADAYNNLGVAYIKLGEPEKAMESFKEAVRIKPDLAEAHYNLGMAYFASGNSDSATREYEILKVLDAGMAEKLFRLIHK
jgi:tetratricopeptide (TPR) repeat protein